MNPNNIPQPERAEIPQFPEQPTEEIIGELANLFEAECIANGYEDITDAASKIPLVSFLAQKDILSEAYRESIIEEINKRYPEGQIELKLD